MQVGAYNYLHIFFVCSVFTLSSFLSVLFGTVSLPFSVLVGRLAETFPASSFRSCRWFDLVVLELIFCLEGLGVLYVFKVAKMLEAKVRKIVYLSKQQQDTIEELSFL